MPRIILFACSLVEHRKLLASFVALNRLQSYNNGGVVVKVCFGTKNLYLSICTA